MARGIKSSTQASARGTSVAENTAGPEPSQFFKSLGEQVDKNPKSDDDIITLEGKFYDRKIPPQERVKNAMADIKKYESNGKLTEGLSKGFEVQRIAPKGSKMTTLYVDIKTTPEVINAMNKVNTLNSAKDGFDPLLKNVRDDAIIKSGRELASRMKSIIDSHGFYSSGRYSDYFASSWTPEIKIRYKDSDGKMKTFGLNPN